MKKLTLISMLVLLCTGMAFAQVNNLDWKYNFGGMEHNFFKGITNTNDGGFVAVGASSRYSFGYGDWTGIPAKYMTVVYNASIVKFGTTGSIIWKKNFGGWYTDYFNKVITTDDGGFVAVGYSSISIMGNADWSGLFGCNGLNATIVKYDSNGNLLWRKAFGGNVTGGLSSDYFNSIVSTSTGDLIAVGYSNAQSFNNGTWTGISSKGQQDATVIKFDSNGNIIWKKR